MALPCVGIELAWCMEDGGVFHSRLVAVPLHRMNVQQSRSRHVLDASEGVHQRDDIMSVLWSEVPYVDTLEHIVLIVDEGFDGVVQTYDTLFTILGEPSPVKEFMCSLVAQSVIGAGGVQLVQVFVHSSHGTVYAHVVVVKDDEHVVGRAAYVIETFECQASTHGTVTYHGNHVSVDSLLLCRHCHTECGGDAYGGMAAGGGVVFALLWRWKRPDATEVAIGVELFSSAGKYLVSVSLMPHIPHDSILGCVEDIMQSHGEFYDSKATGKMSRIAAEFIDEAGAEFLAHLGEFLDGQFTQVRGVFYGGEQRQLVCCHVNEDLYYDKQRYKKTMNPVTE